MEQRKPEIQAGAVVQVTKWTPHPTGTVVRREDDDVFVAYHGSFVEDQVDVGDVDLIPDPTPEQASWRGGMAVSTPGGWSVVPVHQEG